MMTKTIGGLLAAIGLYAGTSINALASLAITTTSSLPGQPTPPGGVAGWLTADIQDISGGVQITFTSANVNNISISQVDLNSTLFNSLGTGVNPGITLGPSSSKVLSASFGADEFKAGSVGFFDIEIQFKQGTHKFGKNESLSVDLLGTGLTAASFNALSKIGNGGGSDAFLMVAHIQDIVTINGQSTWASGRVSAVPEPTTWISGALVLLPVAGTMIRKLRRNRFQ